MTSSRLPSRLALAGALTMLSTTALAAAPAEAKGRDGVMATGRCSSTGTWKLKAKHDDGRIEVEFEVDINRNGRIYNVTINDNGTRVFTGRRTTLAPSGSFNVERRVANRAGADRFTARATRGTNVCAAAVTLP